MFVYIAVRFNEMSTKQKVLSTPGAIFVLFQLAQFLHCVPTGLLAAYNNY